VPVADAPGSGHATRAALAAVLLLGCAPAALLSRRVRHRLGAGSESGLRRRLCVPVPGGVAPLSQPDGRLVAFRAAPTAALAAVMLFRC
jgi:hypothetical protein